MLVFRMLVKSVPAANASLYRRPLHKALKDKRHSGNACLCFRFAIGRPLSPTRSELAAISITLFPHRNDTYPSNHRIEGFSVVQLYLLRVP
jgi:hypothetical protein